MRMKIVLLVALILLATALACDFSTKPINSMTLLPDYMDTYDDERMGGTDVSCGLACGPLPPLNCALGPGEVVTAGYLYSSDPGTEPCPCTWWADCFWRGVVTFDLTPLQGKGIVSAELTYDVTSDIDLGTTATNENNCLAKVAVATGSVGAGIAGDELASFPTVQTADLEGPINISSTVRSWVDGSLPNSGLLFIGFDELLPTDQNRRCVAEITNVRLTVMYTD